MNAIETFGLGFSYDSRSFIENLNLVIPSNSIYGFLGPNGAGKTTIIKLLTGLLISPKGDITYWGKSLKKKLLEIKKSFGCLIEEPSLYEHLTAKENLFYLEIIHKMGASRIDYILNLVGLKESKNQKVKSFSQGMKQRLGLAMALYSDPHILILDEPTNSLDPNGIVDFRLLLRDLHKNHGKTIFISSHALGEIEKLCTHVGMINKGKIVFQGEINELIGMGAKTVAVKTDNNNNAYNLLRNGMLNVRLNETNLTIFLKEKHDLNVALKLLIENDISIEEASNETTSLEEVFFNLIKIR